MAYVVALSGWRLHMDHKFIRDELFRIAMTAVPAHLDLFFRVGDAKGADAICREFLRTEFPNSFQIYSADWDQFGLKAGPLRNREMLTGTMDQHGLASLLVAFPQPQVYRYQDSGTWGCAKEAFRLGIEVSVPAYPKEGNESGE